MQLFPSHTVSAPSVHITYPPGSLFKFPPKSVPNVLTPPVSDSTFARPFNISPEVYNDLLSINLPISIALLYVTTVVVVSRLNAERKHKPWAISQTRAFYAFVILHNVFLALFSAWTFFGMLNAIRKSWPGLVTKGSITDVVDALCKINGPRGLGNAATYNPLTGSWGVTNQAIKLLGGEPDSTDVGRIWNEGLAFYGWLFYLSKFYETIDTMIILAKGKKSSVLQTYHHAGAMMCMWAGIRYMAPPIWMFVLVNSGVHALMYTYYTATALGFRVTPAIKRSLTTLQIAQFVIGVPYAFAHLFIAYNIPVNTPYLYSHNLSNAIPSVTSSLSSAISSATAIAGVGPWLKKIALRAAGEEGLAENVHNYQGQRFGLDATHNENVERSRGETRYRLEYPKVHCIDTSGQVFAILLNVMYLAPLTYLFAVFFIRSYIGRTSSSTTHPTHAHTLQKSGHDALKGVEREIHEAMGSDLSDMSPEIMHGSVSDAKAYAGDKYDEVKARASEGYENAKPKVEEVRVKLGESFENIKSQAGPKVEEAKDWMGESYQNIKAEAGPYAEEFKTHAGEVTEKVKTESRAWFNWFGKKSKEAGNATSQKAKESVDVALPKAKEAATTAANKTNDISDLAVQKMKELRDQAAPKIKEEANKAAKTTKSYANAAGTKAQEAKDQAEPKLKEGAARANSTASAAADKANKTTQDAVEKAGPKINEAKDKAGKKAQDAADTTSAKANEAADKAPKTTKEAADKGRDRVHEAVDKGSDRTKEGAEVTDKKVKEGADTATRKTKDSADSVNKTTKAGADSADQKVKEGVDKASSAATKSKAATDGADRKDLDESDDDTEDPAAYEATIDDVKSKEEDTAEAEMQPEGAGP